MINKDSSLNIVKILVNHRKFLYFKMNQCVLFVKFKDFSKISANIRQRPECNGFMINCTQLYLPETLFIEHEKDYSEDNIAQLFNKKRIFHIKSYSYCSFVHFYSHEGKQENLIISFVNDSYFRL